jgi:hypothetical protein
MNNPLLPNVNPNPQPQPTVTWPGASGIKYSFNLHKIGAVFLAVPGVYIFCKGATATTWQQIYVGETDNLLRRLTNELAAHHRWECAKRHGATHICALRVDGGNAERIRTEIDLRHGLNPPCNRE